MTAGALPQTTLHHQTPRIEGFNGSLATEKDRRESKRGRRGGKGGREGK